MRVCLENTRHIVLLGYSLPPDDEIYRAMLATRKSRSKSKVYCSMVVGLKGPKHWLTGADLEKHVTDYDYKSDKADYGVDTIKAAWDIFGKEHVRAFTGGIPLVFGSPEPSRENILNLLYPVNVGIDEFTSNGVIRK